MVVGFTKYLTEDVKLSLGTIRLKNRKIVWDNVCKLAYDIFNRNLITFFVSVISVSFDKLELILW